MPLPARPPSSQKQTCPPPRPTGISLLSGPYIQSNQVQYDVPFAQQEASFEFIKGCNAWEWKRTKRWVWPLHCLAAETFLQNCLVTWWLVTRSTRVWDPPPPPLQQASVSTGEKAYSSTLSILCALSHCKLYNRVTAVTYWVASKEIKYL